MDLQVTSNAITMIRQLITPNATTEPVLETVPNKAEFFSKLGERLPRATPEEKGVPSEIIEEYLRSLVAMEELDMHAVTIVKDGAVIAEASFGAYDREVWHVSYSECKSVISLAVGLLVDEGKLALDDKVVKLLADEVPVLSQLTLRDLTVEHLLTMTSGVLFNEAGSVTAEDWVKSYLESVPTSAPGEKFAYNSMNTYMLSAIVRKVAGVGVSEFLKERLFGKMGIGGFYWEKCPKGIEKGGWGLYMCQEDWAKIGLLVMNRGAWKGEQLISAEWIDAACSPKQHPPENFGDYDYGYQIWTGRHIPSFLFSGMFGQNVLGFTRTGLILVTNAGNDEMFQQSDFFTVTHELLGRNFASSLGENAKAAESLREYIEGLKYGANVSSPSAKRPFYKKASPAPALPAECDILAGKKYVAVSKNAASAGLEPLFMQALQNTYSAGLLGFAFDKREDKFYVTIAEKGAEYVLPVGFLAPERLTLSFGGEPHLVAVTGRFATDEDDRLVLILRMSMLETASARHIRFYFSPDLKKAESRWTEKPGVGFLKEFLADAMPESKRHPALTAVTELADSDYIDYRMRAAFEMRVTAEIRELGK